MNEATAKLIAPDDVAVPPEKKSVGKKLTFLAAVFFCAQLALVWFLGTKKQTVPQAVTNVPHFTLTADTDEIVALSNPTLFNLPHAHDFSTKVWTQIPTPKSPDFRWHETPRWLLIDPNNLGGALKDFLQTNAAAETPLHFKPEPELSFTEVLLEPLFAKNSTLQITGQLASRKLLSPIAPPTLSVNDVILPTRVQLLVAGDGHVFSAVLLEPTSGNTEADQTAERLARAAEFAPADGLMFGEMIFKWHTVAVVSTNSPETK